MDLQRSLLIGSIGLLSFMLLTQWVNFKQEHTASVPVVASSPSPVPDMRADTAELPVIEAPVDADDIPTAGEPIVPKTKAVANTRIIVATTDALRVTIDLNGGDIIEVALPQFLANIDVPDIPFILLENNQTRQYIAQSGLVGNDGIDKDGRASFSAEHATYSLDDNSDTLLVDLHYTGSGDVDITKRFTLRRGDHLVDVEYLINNRSDARWQANLFGQIKRDSSSDPNADTSGMGMVPFLGSAITSPEERFIKFDFEDMAEKPFKQKLPGGWIAMIQHYFLSAWIPNPQLSHTYSTRVTSSGFNIAGFTSPAVIVDPGKTGSVKAQFYAGPKDQYRLEEISPYLELSVDYGWLWWIAQPLFWLLTKIQSVVSNWGISIILLTVLVKAAFFQLSATSFKSMANMRRVQPQLQDIKERYGEDKQKQSQAMMELYKKEKINPLSGCLPILVQMPVFISLYWVLMESYELRHAPFYGWIHDLSVMDPYFILPLIMGVSMFVQQRLNPPPPDPMQAKVMQWMPVMFTFFFLWFPAGLVLYWVANNLLSITQQWVITRQIEKATAKA